MKVVILEEIAKSISMNKTNQVNISVRINKKQGMLIGISLVLLFIGIASATSSASSDVEIYALL